MHPLRLLLLLCAFAPAGLMAQAVVSGSVSVGGGGALLDGNLPSFQQAYRQHKTGFGGVEELTVTRVFEDTQLRLEGRALPGNEDYRFFARWEQFDAWFLEASYRQFRTFYNGAGGRLLPRDMAISYFDEELALDRSFFHVQFGTQKREGPQLRLRYDRLTRDGSKSSIRWGDSNLAGAPYSPRAFIPSYYLIDERRDILTAEVSDDTGTSNWRLRARREHTTVDNRHVARRRALEPQERYVTGTDLATTDLFSGHAFYERIFNPKLRASAGGLVTSIDTVMAGSNIVGDRPGAPYSTTVAGRQSTDKNFFGLLGNTRLKQYVGHANLVYQPAKYWILRPGLKYEHLRRDSGALFTDTSFTGAALTAVQNATDNDSRNSWNEATADVEARYTRWADWSLSTRAVLNRGTGTLAEQSILVANGAPVIDRDTRYERTGQRYTVDLGWYARPGLTLGLQLNHRIKDNDYRSRRDNTANDAVSKDRYPAFILDHALDATDAALRASWRPRPTLSFVSRYSYQRASVESSFADLPELRTSLLRRHVVTETATWNATPRLNLTGAVNLTYDQLTVPAHTLAMNSDNNYLTGSLGAGYALGKVTDVFVDANYVRADNYIDNPLTTLPLNAGHLQQSVFLTWVRRHSARLIFTARYGFATYRDGTYGGQNDFTAHLLYAKVQYKF